MIAHVVLFEPKADCSLELRTSLIEALTKACTDIPGVLRANIGKRLTLGVGYENSIGVSTYSYVAIIEFGDKPALLSYLAHPIHERLGRLFWQACERTLIVDSETHDMRSKDLINFL